MNIPAVWTTVTIFNEFLHMPCKSPAGFSFCVFSSLSELRPASTVNLELQCLLENKFIRMNPLSQMVKPKTEF